MNAYNEVLKGVQWVLDNRTSYEVAKDLGISNRTINRYQNGTTPIDNMTAKTMGTIYNYYLREMGKMTIKQAIEYGLSIDWVKAVTGQDAVDEAIEELANMYVDTDLTVEQFVFEKLQEEGRVKDDDAFDDEAEANEQGYYWYDEVSKWIDVE